jgi:hypothetical protein
MKVKELIEQLKKYDQEKTVVSFCGPLQESATILYVDEYEDEVIIY